LLARGSLIQQIFKNYENRSALPLAIHRPRGKAPYNFLVEYSSFVAASRTGSSLSPLHPPRGRARITSSGTQRNSLPPWLHCLFRQRSRRL
jgi:hypothetical protein